MPLGKAGVAGGPGQLLLADLSAASVGAFLLAPSLCTLPGERWLCFPNSHRALNMAKGSNVEYSECIRYFPAWFFVPACETRDILIAASEDLLYNPF